MLSHNGLIVTLSGFSLFDDRIQGFRFAPSLAENRRPYRANWSAALDYLFWLIERKRTLATPQNGVLNISLEIPNQDGSATLPLITTCASKRGTYYLEPWFVGLKDWLDGDELKRQAYYLTIRAS